MVDDGSTDTSASVADDYAHRFSNVRLISSTNQGLGAARNLGVRHSRGEYLAFADSDDLVPPGAYALLVSTLEETGSDFVVGSLQRLVAGQLVGLPFLQAAHRQRRMGITIDDLPEIMRNVFAFDKVFRRSFWDRASLTFPVGLRYEDQVAMTEAYLRARAFDVVRRPVYVWRVRGDGASITQRRHELADLDDRLVTKAMTTDIVATLGTPRVREYWAYHGLGGDLPVYFREIPDCDDRYWEHLVSGVRRLFAGEPPIHESRLLRTPQRLVGWLVTHDRRDQAEIVLRWLEEHPGALPLRTEGSRVIAELPFHDDAKSGIPPELFSLAEHELEYDARLLGADWNGQRLELSGIALIRGAPTTGVSCLIGASLRSSTGDRVDLHVERRPSPEATRWVNRPPQRYDDCGFSAQIDVAALTNRGAPRAGDRWQVLLSVDVAGIHREGPFRTTACELDLLSVAERDTAIQLAFKPGEGLVVRWRA